MSLADDGPVREQIMKSDNPYAEVMRLAALARKKSKECSYQIRDSEALTWAIQGIEPKYQRPNRVKNCITRYEHFYIKELLCYIDDDEVKAALEESFRESKAARNLVYKYKTIEDEPRKARVRVLLRMVWYNITD